MTQDELLRFRLMCGRFHRLAVFMVVSVGTVLALGYLVLPLWQAGRSASPPDHWLASVMFGSPALFYLAGVWFIGRALGDLSRGRLIQPTLSHALRCVGLSLATGGAVSVFLVTNLVRLVEGGRGGWLHFDVPGMTLGMIGGALFLLSRVMDRATEVQAELDEMI